MTSWPSGSLLCFFGIKLPSYIGILGYSKVEHIPCFNRDEPCPTFWSLKKWYLAANLIPVLDGKCDFIRRLRLRILSILLRTFQFVPRIWQQEPTSTLLSGWFLLKPKVTLFSGSPTPIHLATVFGGSRVQLKNLKQNHGIPFFWDRSFTLSSWSSDGPFVGTLKV